MTVGELLVYNSTIATGKVLTHMMNIRTTREAIDTVTTDIVNNISFDVRQQELFFDSVTHEVVCDIIDNNEINVQNKKLEVSV